MNFSYFCWRAVACLLITIFPLVKIKLISFCNGLFFFRKPRINPQLVAQQVAQQYNQPQPKQKSSKPERDKKSSSDKAAKKIRYAILSYFSESSVI